MLKRIKRMIELSKKDPEALKVLENLTEEQLDQIPEAGDGKAVFIGEGTHEEWEDQKKEDEGTKPWYERLKQL